MRAAERCRLRDGAQRDRQNAIPAARPPCGESASTAPYRPGRTAAAPPRATDGRAGWGGRRERGADGRRARRQARQRWRIGGPPARRASPSPRCSRYASSGASTGPSSTRVARMRASSSGAPTTTPPVASEWPPRYFVALCTTRSAPHSSGRSIAGEANVESTAEQCAARRRDCRQRGDVGHQHRRVGERFGPDDLRAVGHGGGHGGSVRSGRRTSSRSPKRASVLAQQLVRAAVAAGRARRRGRPASAERAAWWRSPPFRWRTPARTSAPSRRFLQRATAAAKASAVGLSMRAYE